MSIIPAACDPGEVERALFTVSGRLAFDIGGNTGRVAVGLSRRFERVVSCEPCAESFEVLRDASSDLPHVEVLPVAITDHDGDVTLDVQEHPIKSGQLTTGGYDGWGRVIGSRTVPARTLDGLAAEYGAPDFVKIDVEAHELQVVRGGLRTLQHAPALYLEVHAADLGAQIVDLLRPVYGGRLVEVRHPHYKPGSWGAENHYWLLAKREMS